MLGNLLNNELKERSMQVCQDIIERHQSEPEFLCRDITRDKTMIFEYVTL